MKQLLTSNQMKGYDTFTIEQMGIPVLVLMERAALAVFEELMKPGYDKDKVLVLCGTGNNGADGIAIARMLTLKKYQVDVKILGDTSHLTEEAKIQMKIAQNFNVNFVQDINVCEYTTIVDAIFGVGLSRDIEGNLADSILQVNRHTAKVVAVDLPSGIDSTTGKVLGCAIRATTTVTFSFEKVGQYLYPGQQYCGELLCKDVGIVKDCNTLTGVYHALEKKDLALISKRDQNGNKGSFGKILIVAGSEDICGAAYLCANAAFRMGAGMVKIFTHANNKGVLLQQLPEAMISTYSKNDLNLKQLEADCEWADVLGIGPGLSTSSEAEQILEFILKRNQKPLVIDADGINLLSDKLSLLKAYNPICILTPHMGEMARLTSTTVKELKDRRVEISTRFASEYPVTLILKDARTLIHVKGLYQYINTSGNEGMATAGSGDVLTGIILGLLGRKVPEQYVGALGVYLHGVLGDIAKEELGSSYMMATDLIKAIPNVLE